MGKVRLDCIIIGYNEIPFDQYEQFLANYGEESEAYRDLKFSFVNIAGKKLDYPGLLNYVASLAWPDKLKSGFLAKFKSGDIPNLAAVYLTNFLRKRNFTAKYINLFQYEKAKLIEYLLEDPICIAITTTFYVVNLPVNEMVEFIRRYNSKVKIIVGGPLVANHARNNKGEALEAALEDIGADIYVIEGSGELTLSATIECLKSGGGLSEIPNLVYFENGGLHRTAILPENNSLDENAIDWCDLGDEMLGPTIQTRTARSCAFNCSFCNYPARAGKLTLASIETIEKEISSIEKLGYVSNIVLIDDTFNVPLPRFKDVCRMIISRGYKFNWFSYFRCSNSDEEAFDLMARSGCKGVFLGIESGSPTVLKNMNKAATVEKYAEGIRMLHERNILTFGSFIVGFPGETAETVKETLDFIKETRPDYYRVQSWYCEPGTPIDRHRAKYGITGEGFVWKHATMDSLEAMDHIEKIFLSVNESLWLPQWSFDFWIIPYLIGRGLSPENFKEFMINANKMLALEIAVIPEGQKRSLQQRYLQNMVCSINTWKLTL